MSAAHADRRIVADPNVTPMIDVLLVLLVAFLVALPSNRTIDAQLPQQNTGSGSARIALTVQRGGGFRLNGEIVPDEVALGRRLREVYAGRPDRMIFVGAEDGVSYQMVIAAMDAARGAGVRVIGITPKKPR